MYVAAVETCIEYDRLSCKLTQHSVQHVAAQSRPHEHLSFLHRHILIRTSTISVAQQQRKQAVLQQVVRKHLVESPDTYVHDVVYVEKGIFDSLKDVLTIDPAGTADAAYVTFVCPATRRSSLQLTRARPVTLIAALRESQRLAPATYSSIPKRSQRNTDGYYLLRRMKRRSAASFRAILKIVSVIVRTLVRTIESR